MFDWLKNTIGGLFGKKKDDKKQQVPAPAPVQPAAPAAQPTIQLGQPKQQQITIGKPQSQPTISIKPQQPSSTNSLVLAASKPATISVPSTPNQISAAEAPKVLTPDAQQKWADDKNLQTKIMSAPVKQDPEKGTALDFVKNYLNPFGKHGIWGKESIAQNTKVIDDAANSANSWIDNHVDPGSANGKLDSPMDAVRFAAKLPIGMLQGVSEVPRDTREAVTGQRLNTDANGNITSESNLSGAQRVGAGVNAVINGPGMAYGGSGTLLKSFLKQGTKDVAGDVAKTGFTNVVKEIGKDSIREGAENGIQSFATDLQQNGQFDDGSLGRAAENFGLGAAGGGMMSAAGRVNTGIRNKLSQDSGIKQGVRDASLPTVTNIAPKNNYERSATIQHGIVTPETKNMSIDEKVQTALNSDIGEQVRYRQVSEPKYLYHGTTPEAVQSMRSTGLRGDLNEFYMTDNPANTSHYGKSVVSIDPSEFNILDARSPEAVELRRLSGLDPANDFTYGNELHRELVKSKGYDGVSYPTGKGERDFEIYNRDKLNKQLMNPIDQSTIESDGSISNRLGAPGENISRGDMQQIQLENNRMFGDASPNVEFKDGVMLTPDGKTALGSTTDIATGPSKIAIARQQGDPRATYLHESVHKALNDYMTSDERAQVVLSYINDKRLGNPDGLSPDEHMRAAEELMSEDFIQYVGNRASKEVPSPKLTQRVADIFERVFRRLQLMTTKMLRNSDVTPEYKQFYNDLYSGEYATKPVMDKSLRNSTPEQQALIEHRDMLQRQFDSTSDPASRNNINQALTDVNTQLRSASADSSLRNSVAYRTDPEKAVRVVETFKQLLKAPAGKMARFGAVSDKTKSLISNVSGEKVNDHASIVVESGYAKHFNKHTRDGEVPLSEGDIANLTEVVNNPDSVRPGKFVRGSQRVVLTKQLDNRTSAVVEVIKEGDALNVVTYFNESPRVPDAVETPQGARPKRGEPIHDNNIANNSDNVNSKRYRVDDTSDMTPSQRQAVRRAIDDVIYEQNPELMARARYSSENMAPPLTEDANWGDASSIPRLHVDDLRHHLGKQVESIPSYYKRRDGPRNIDLNAQNAFGGNVDDYLNAWLGEIEKKATDKQMVSDLRELRNDPEVQKQAETRVRQRIDEAKVEIKDARTARDAALNTGDLEIAKDAEDYIAALEKEVGIKPSKRYTATNAPVYNERYSSRVEKFAEFTDSKADAETLADMAPQVAKVEQINSKTRKLHLPGGDTAIRLDVGGPRTSSVQEFAVRSTIDPVTEKTTVDLVPLDGSMHTLKNGMVVDKNGKSVGSYASIDDKGNQIAYIEGKPVNITKILGDVEQWGNLNKASWDMDRLIETNAPDKGTARRVQKFITQFKDQQESMMKTELLQRRMELQKLEKDAYKNLPKGISKKELREDLFRITEKKAEYSAMVQKYGQDYMDKYIRPTVVWWRNTADSVLKSTNSVLEQNGYDAIPRLDNYITHIQADPNFWEKVGIGIKDINPMGSSISSDINPGSTRGGIPEEIVGKTENTGVRRKWNPFAQTRRGSQHEQDFFKAIDSYFEPMLFNKYMTPAASRTRVVERTFRTFEKAKEIREQEQINELAAFFGVDDAQRMVHNQRIARNNSKYKKDRRSPMITAWQEYGNILAGKTNALDRLVIDKGGLGGAAAMSASTKSQGIVGASTIPGSATAAIAQMLSIPQTIGRDSLKSFAKATRQMMLFEGKRAGSNDPMRKSAFMRARYTDASSLRKGIVRKYTDAASKPMELIERATSELSWRSAYNDALSKGLSEKEAISQADIQTKKTLAGRGIGDRPYIMNSKALGAFTQFGLEVNNMRIQYWRDFTPKQKIKFMVAAYAMNAALQAVTGNSQLPDYIKAIFDSLADFQNSDDDKKDTPLDNAKQALQRFLGETSKFVPGAPAVAGIFMDDRTKEQVFGKNLDMSRYGTPAASRVTDPLVKLWNGDWGGALASAGSLLPTGTQAKRTISGVTTLSKGYTENSRGNVQNVYDNSSLPTQAQATIFGSKAIPGQADAIDSGRALDKTQSEAFRQLYSKDPGIAREYFNQAMDIKVQKSNKKGTPTDTGYKPDSASALDVKSAAEMAEVNVKLKEEMATGKVIQKNGVYFTKGGNVKTDYYKSLAQTSKAQDDSTYKAYLLGYGLSKGTRYDPGGPSQGRSGNATVDKLEGIKDTKDASGSTLSNAMALYKGDKSEVPDWVKERFYKEAGWTKDQVGYAAQASYNTDQKLEGLYRPIAAQGDHQLLMDSLMQGRVKSIANTKSASDAVITALYKEGYLSKAEQKYLKSLTIDQDGSQKVSTSSLGGGRRKKGGKRGESEDISSYLKGTKQHDNTLSSIVKKYGSISMGSASPRVNSPRMRSLTAAGRSTQGGKKSGFKRKL